jgi:hypothetical protein
MSDYRLMASSYRSADLSAIEARVDTARPTPDSACYERMLCQQFGPPAVMISFTASPRSGGEWSAQAGAGLAHPAAGAKDGPDGA